MSTYDQLCGALGMLKRNNVELDYPAINEHMRGLGRRAGVARFGDQIAKTPPTGFADPVFAEIQAMHRQYRDMCLEHSLIERGYLFDDRDCVPLV